MDKPPPLTYPELHLQCEKLKSQAALDNIAFGNMSKEIIDLNDQLEKLLRELSSLVEHLKE